MKNAMNVIFAYRPYESNTVDLLAECIINSNQPVKGLTLPEGGFQTHTFISKGEETIPEHTDLAQRIIVDLQHITYSGKLSLHDFADLLNRVIAAKSHELVVGHPVYTKLSVDCSAAIADKYSYSYAAGIILLHLLMDVAIYVLNTLGTTRIEKARPVNGYGNFDETNNNAFIIYARLA